MAETKDIRNQDTMGSMMASAPSGLDPSAPGGENFSDFKSEQIDEIEPLFKSFSDFAEDNKNEHSEWLKEPDSKKDFFTLCEDKKWVEENKEWIKKSNAEKQVDLLAKANNRDIEKGENVNEFMNTATVGTRVQHGEVLFCTNRNKQVLYGEGCWQFTTKPFTIQARGPVDLKKEMFVEEQNIRIITLKPNQIGVALLNRKPVILLPGRHCFNDPNFVIQEKNIHTLEKDKTFVKALTITIVMILPGYVGFGYEKAKPVLLKPGLHVSRVPSFQHEMTINARTLRPTSPNIEKKLESPGTHINHGNIHIVRVKPSEIGTARVDGKPAFLAPGLHIKNDPSFCFFGIKDRNANVIQFQNLCKLQVPTNLIGLGWEENRPIIIPPGIWSKINPLFRFDRFEPANKPKIKHGSITRYVIHNGDIGFAWNNAQVEELQPGIRIVDNPNFILEDKDIYKKHTPVIKFGNIAHVTTQQGYCRPVYQNGELIILHSGYKKFTNPNLVVEDAFPIGQIILRLKQMEVLTRDRTPMLVTGQVTYQVDNPKNLILNLGYDKLQKSLEKTIDAILRHAFSLTDLSTISPDTHKEVVEGEMQEKKKKMALFRQSQDDSDGEGDDSSNFQNLLCSQVKKELIKNTQSWGVRIMEIALSDIQFKDQEVAEKLATATSMTRTTEAEFDLVQAKNKIRIEKARTDANEKLIAQTNEAQVKKIKVENQSQLALIEQKATVEAKAMKRDQEIKSYCDQIEKQAIAEATKIRKLAEAKRDAAKLEAEGKKALAQAAILKYSDPNILQLEMMKLWVQGCKKLVNAPQPAVLLQSGNSEGGPGGLVDSFRRDGASRLEKAFGSITEKGRNR